MEEDEEHVLCGVNETQSFSFVLSRFAILELLRITQLKLPSLHIITAF